MNSRAVRLAITRAGRPGLVAALLRQVHLAPMPAGFDLALRDRTGTTFYGRQGVFAENPVLQRIALQDGEWDAAAIPRGGWFQGVRRQVWFFRLVGLGFAGLLAFVLYLIAQRDAARQQHVRELARSEAEVWRKALRVSGTRSTIRLRRSPRCCTRRS
jgi:hypothetical protein